MAVARLSDLGAVVVAVTLGGVRCCVLAFEWGSRSFALPFVAASDYDVGERPLWTFDGGSNVGDLRLTPPPCADFDIHVRDGFAIGLP